VSEAAGSKVALVRRLLPGVWAGMLLCVALIATPAPFATLPPHDAGRVVNHIFLREAWLSIAMGAILVVLARRQVLAGSDRAGSQFSVEMQLALGAIFCTVAGYFGLQPMMEAARAGQGSLSFGHLHAISLVLFAAKTLLVVALALRVARASA
jgi:hypothetical protein